MASLPVLSGWEVVKAFESLGWSVARQSSSHIIMTKQDETVTLSRITGKLPRAHFAA